MQTTVLHHVRTVLYKPWTRVFSTTTRQSQLSRPLRSGKLVKTLWKDTRDPVWGLVDALHARKDPLKLSAALANYRALPGELDAWKHVIYQPDITSAVAALRKSGFTVAPPAESELLEVSPSPPPSQHPPSWVVLYLTAFKVRTSQQVLSTQLDLTYAHLATAPLEVQGPLLILTVLNLIRFNLLVPMRRVIDTFLAIPLHNPALEFNLLLQIIAWNPLRSTDVASAVVALLKTMQSRQLSLNIATYDVLLRDRFVTLQLTKYLHQQMIEENIVPTASHLEAYLRVFAKHGAIHDAEEYHKTIHALPAATESLVDMKDTHARADTLLLAAQKDRASAFGFLRKLVTPEKFEPDRPPHLVIRHRMRRRTMVDAFDFTAALTVAVRDRSKSGASLIAMFEQAQSRPCSIRLTVASYTVLIRGLLVRESSRAVEYWKALEATGLPIDRAALSVGLRALTSGGSPHKAFQTLQKYAAPNGHIPEGIYQLRQPLRLIAPDINEFMVGLTRVRRPDVVFKLWDHMDELYGVRPDVRSLSILLHAARVAGKMDDSFSGAMAHLALKNPFRTPQPMPTSPDSIVSGIKEILHDESGNLRPYVSGIWHDQSPMEVARKIFLQAIFGSAPATLLGVTSPAHAIRASPDADGMQGMGLPRLGPKRTPFVLPPDLLTPRGETYYPSIIVSNEVCMRYLYLLEAMSRISEVPLLLAWMRELRITPKQELLAMALVLWSEISVQAPLIEAWAGGAERNEYTRLVEWLQDWVGRKQMPSEGMLDRWRRIVARNREI
ncbi:hypothetical protein BDZ94DRAFT_777866 [Collybia nuda]|uniref:Pentatricopeptide repeat-containing protein n=1 Tax=Collybia nuda TaxID=64659 RepID=A0A9P5YG39_9AGAR|nr:hypothetical protein BDZ94DRAFT_777866 [Collybia nuda]